MISFDASEIANWSDKPDAQHQLPELIRRLVMATVPMPSLLDIPSGSSVRLPDWDGLLVVENGNAWVPGSASAWEFSCEKNPKRKATEDYEKRTADSKGVDISSATFVFATSRRWPAKRNWTKECREEGRWANVRALDADDLVAWLEQAPAVAHWFARLIGKLPAIGVVPLVEWWENWSTVANPQIPPELVTAGRQDQAERIAQWFEGGPSHYYVQGDTQDEAIAFLAACAHASASSWGAVLLAGAIVVQTADAWRSLEGHPQPLVLVRDFSGGNVSPQIAVGRGHHVLTPLGQHQEPNGAGVTLPRLGRDETPQALVAMGLSEANARSLIRSTARRLPIIRRQLVDEAGGPTPEWASSSTPHSIVALVLVGQWEGDHEGDKAIVAEVVGQPYETVERDLMGLMSVGDSPLAKVGNRWRFISHEEVWHVLAPRLTSSDVGRFEKIAAKVFGTVSPEFELPIEERYMAGIKGKVLPHSGTLREGIARSLALMGTHSDRAKNVDGAPYVPWRVVSSVLANGGGWQTWATLEIGNLAVLAEASPEALLDAIERDLDADPSPFEDLFAQEGDGLFRGTPHTGLLWALELLAWSPDHFARVAKCLARLAEIDPGGQVSNRPAASLGSLFLPWKRFSEALDEHRLETLKMLLGAVPRAGWRLLVGAHPSSRAIVIDRRPPSWQPWAQDGAPEPTVEEYHSFVGEMDRLLIENAGADAGRWADLVGIISDLSPEVRQRAIDLLSQQISALRQHPDLDNLWGKLREQLHRHRRCPHAGWAMDLKDTEALDSVYQQLTPSDPVAANAWLFDSWPDLPNPTPVDLIQEAIDFGEGDNQVTEARRAAARSVYESGGTAAIIAIAAAANYSAQLGVAVADALDSGLALDLALECLESRTAKLLDLTHGILRGLFWQSRWQLLQVAIDRVKARASPPQALADVYLAAIPGSEVWHRLESEGGEVQTRYWKSIGRPSTAEWNSEDMAFAAQQLISVNRSPEAVAWLAYSSPSNEVMMRMLEAVPHDMGKAESLRAYNDNLCFNIAYLFGRLDRSESVREGEIARLEIPYLGVLLHHRPDMAFYREVCKDPSLFADLVSWRFSRSDGHEDEDVDDQTRLNRAHLAFNTLWRLRGLPGLAEDGSIDSKGLLTWISEARRLCKERDREVIGDQQVGQVLANAPVGDDGIWPCEPVRDLLDALASHHIGIGFTTGRSNLRGVTSRGPFEGGEQEQSLADRYREDAAKITAKWPFAAQLLSKLATNYEADARQEDHEANWSDQFES